MGGIIELAGVMLSRAEERATVVAQNIANLTTPGFRSVSSFSQLVTIDDPDLASGAGAGTLTTITTTPGKLISTDNPLDLALSGNGFFVVRSGDTVYLTRAGQFTRDDVGRLVNADGDALQTDQGDCIIDKGAMVVDADGAVRVDGNVIGRLTVADVADPSSLRSVGSGKFAVEEAAMRRVESPSVRQGMLESSNVSHASEMLSMMALMRSAETGQRVVQLYDDLMAQVITGFGQGQS